MWHCFIKSNRFIFIALIFVEPYKMRGINHQGSIGLVGKQRKEEKYSQRTNNA